MTENSKRKTLILLGAVVIITIIIAASLPQLKLQPGVPLPKLDSGQVAGATGETVPYRPVTLDKYVILGIIFLVTGSMLYVAYKLLRGTGWKTLLGFIKPMSIIILAAMGIVFLISLMPESNMPVSEDVSFSSPKPQLPVSQQIEVPPLMFWLVGGALLVVTILISAVIFTSISKRRAKINNIGLEAEKAWQDLKTGLDLKSVIVRCYRQMSLALEEGRKLERKEFMTTREFEALLEEEGVPYEPVHQLTRLFEAVRYGNWQPNPTDEQKAINCLEALVLFSHETKKAK